MKRINASRHVLPLAIVAVLLSAQAMAQQADTQATINPVPAEPAASTDQGTTDPNTTGPNTTGQNQATTLDTVVVSGTAKFKGLRKRDASFSISTVNPEQIQEVAPTSTADLLKVVPGVWAEATGGSTGANVFIRGMPTAGDAPFLTLQLDGSPVYPQSSLSFLENSTLFRIDETIARVEALRGGPSPIYSNGQPGVTVNFIQKKGQDTPEGLAKVTLGTGSMQRIDLFSAGPLAPGSGWYYSVGGFWRENDGVRDPGFAANKGGQVSGTLTKRWDDNEFTVYARKTKDDNVFYTAVPLLSRNDGRDISDFPGVDATSGTLIGPDFRRVSLPTGEGAGTMRGDLGKGRGVDVNLFGASLDWSSGDWTISNRFNYLEGDAPTHGLFTGANPQTLGAYISDTFGADAVGTGSFVNGGGMVDPSQQVVEAGWWVVDKAIESFTNDLRFSVNLSDSNTLTFGLYYADYSVKDRWWLGNNMLITAQNHGRRVNVGLADGRIPTRDGFVSNAFLNLRANWDGKNTAFFVADEWTVNDRVRLDAGVRYERQEVDGILWDTENVDLDGNPNTLYDNATSVAVTPRSVGQNDSKLSWTAGVNFTLNPSASLFARVNSGFRFPSFDNLREDVTNTQEIDQYELGLKAGGDWYEAYLTAFYNEFVGLPFQSFTVDGSSVVLIGDSKAKGLEFEGFVRPIGDFELAWNATWLDANYGNFGDFDGNQVVRQPKFRARLTPSYYWSLPWGDAKVFLTYTYVGDRYSDPANGQLLTSYDTFDLGGSLRVGQQWEFNLAARNVTDEIALTEGNARVIGAATSDGVFMGRPLEGRSVEVSAAYRW